MVTPQTSSSLVISDFEAARLRFRMNVAVFDAEIALIVGLDGSSELSARLRKNGTFVLNMPTDIERQAMLRAGLETAFKQLNPAISPSDLEKSVGQALERSIGQGVASSMSESGLMQHELCHTWLNAYIFSLTKANQPLPTTHAAYVWYCPARLAGRSYRDFL